MREKYKYLTKNILLFFISSFVPKLLSFILIPIYTNYLTTSEYGISDLINTTISLLLPIFSLDIHDAVLRFSLDKDYNKNDVFSSALKVNSIGFVFMILFSLFLNKFNFLHLNGIYLLFMVIIYIFHALNNTFTLFCKGIDKVKTITISSILNSIVTLFCNILFLVVFKWGINGYLFANSIGYLISLIFIFFHAKLYKYLSVKPSIKTIKNMVKYSFPLIFSVISWWINESSDRYILIWISGISVSGLYSISYKIPNILMLFQNIFFQAWSISVIKYFDEKDEDGFITRLYNIINMGLVISCSFIMLLNIPIAKILYSNDFFVAWKYVPPLLISVVFNSISLIIGGVFTAVKDTKTISFSTVIGAVINIILNFFLINKMGAYGAALATLIAYFIVMVIRQIIVKKYISIKFNFLKNYFAYFLLLVQMILAIYGVQYINFEIIVFILILVIYNKDILNIFNLVLKFILRGDKK